MNRKHTALSVLMAMGGAMAAAWLAGFDQSVDQMLKLGLAAALAVFFCRHLLCQKDPRAQWCFGLLGFGFALAVGLGMRLETLDQTGWDGLALCGFLGLLWGPAVGGGAIWIAQKLEKLQASETANTQKTFWISFAVLLVCWLPVLLAYFPGLFGYDVYEQVGQIMENQWLTHHPLAHTLLVCGFWAGGGALGSYTMGVFSYALTQLLALAAAMAYALSYLAKLHSSKAVRIALTVLFALAPQHPLMGISVTKDIPFAITMLISCVELLKLLREPGRIFSWKKMIPLASALTGACLFRNNAPMAIAVFAIFALIIIGKGRRVRMISLLCAVLVGQSTINAGLAAVLDAGKGKVNEMLSVPAQQLSRVYAKYGYDEPVSYEIIEWVPNADLYQASRADFTKMHLNVDHEGELTGFIKFWARELFHFPIEYIDAFLLNCKGYWDPNDTSFAAVYGEWPDTSVGALITVRYPIRVEYPNLLPPLQKALDFLYFRNEYQSIPGLSALIHPATYSWMLLYAIAWAIWRKKWAALGTSMLMLMYLLTLFLGPCTLVRYCYYLMPCAPVLTATLISPGEKA